MNRKLDEALNVMIRRHAIAIEDLTESQVAEALKQAIACGDFQRLVRVKV